MSLKGMQIMFDRWQRGVPLFTAPPQPKPLGKRAKRRLRGKMKGNKSASVTLPM